jgi:hypothetical protein
MSTFYEQETPQQIKRRDPATLTENQFMVYNAILEKPRRLAVLYEVFKDTMPNSSVRRILQSLRDDGLSVKINHKEWRGIHYV